MTPSPAETVLAAQQRELHQIIRQRSFFTGQFTLASGKQSSWYLDCRLTALSARGSYLIGVLLYEALAALHIDAVGGMALGAIPLVTAVTARSADVGKHPIDGFFIRKEAKGHGTGKQIEGHLKPWMRVALVEDVVTTGKSTVQAIEAVRREYPTVEIVQILSLVDREEGGSEAFEASGIPYQSLYSAQSFLAEAGLS